jgi:hypothetical protein
MHLMAVYLMGVYLMGVHLMSVRLMGVYLMGVYFMGVYPMGVYLMGVHLIWAWLFRVKTRMMDSLVFSLRMGAGFVELLTSDLQMCLSHGDPFQIRPRALSHFGAYQDDASGCALGRILSRRFHILVGLVY